MADVAHARRRPGRSGTSPCSSPPSFVVALCVGWHGDDRSVDGLLDGPRQVVTTSWPSPRFPTIFVALAALIFLATAFAIDLAMRVRWRALAIVPMVVGMVAMIAVGAPDGPQWQALAVRCRRGVRLAVDRSRRPRRQHAIGLHGRCLGRTGRVDRDGRRRRCRRRSGQPSSRASRPTARSRLVDPLADVAAQQKAEPPRDLYDVESPALAQLHRWRTTSLDVYNGEAWSTSGKLTPVGNRLDEPTPGPSR